MFEEKLRFASAPPEPSATPLFDATAGTLPAAIEPTESGDAPDVEIAPSDVSDIAWSEFEPAGWILDALSAQLNHVSSDTSAIEAVAEVDRVISFANAVKLRYLAAFARLRPPDEIGHRNADSALDRDGNHLVSEFAGDEVAAALNLSRNAACNQLSLALDLTQRLPGTLYALQTGAIDAAKARAVAEATAPLPAATAAVVEEKVLEPAERHTVAELRAALRRAVIAADPDGAQQRHRAQVAQRRVTLTPLDDGMAELWALLPADKATALYQRITALAHNAKTPGDTRGIDTRRADALCDLGASNTDVQLHVTVGVDTMLGADNRPAELGGYGPIPAEMARRLGDDATWRKLLTDPVSGALLDYGRVAYRPPIALADHIRARDLTCRFPGCRRPARACDIDHVVPFPKGPTSRENLACLCRHHHRLKHNGNWQTRLHDDGTLTWTSPTRHRYTTHPPVLAGSHPGTSKSQNHDPPPF